MSHEFLSAPRTRLNTCPPGLALPEGRGVTSLPYPRVLSVQDIQAPHPSVEESPAFTTPGTTNRNPTQSHNNQTNGSAPTLSLSQSYLILWRKRWTPIVEDLMVGEFRISLGGEGCMRLRVACWQDHIGRPRRTPNTRSVSIFQIPTVRALQP